MSQNDPHVWVIGDDEMICENLAVAKKVPQDKQHFAETSLSSRSFCIDISLFSCL